MVADHHRQRDTKPLTRISKFLEHLHQNKGKVIPLSVLVIPSAFLTGCSVEATEPTTVTKSFQTISTWFGTLNATAYEDLLNPKSHMKELMVWLYKTISMIIYTPIFLFDNEFFDHMIRIFASLSAGVVTLGSMIEGFKRILGLSSTSLKQIIARLPLLIGVCGFAPYLFVKAIEAMNNMTQMIISIGTSILGTSTHLPDLEFILVGEAFEVIGLFLFILLYIALLIPMMLNHGRRWFSMIALGILTPFAMLGYVFDSLKNLHQGWWTSLKGLFLVQIVYSIFVTILSLLMFAVPFPTTIEGLFAKLLVILGGLYMLAIPPQSVKKYFDLGPTPKQSYAAVAQKLGKLILRKV
ncbi:hypothetical protein R4Z10_21285 (plasmid) [Niallia sp. XMNu-256]|uniref:hypothetical protein n=1 Tax=Niallia sp. XMNu-256 TaxID=3082444 RepID=UPI0030CD0609